MKKITVTNIDISISVRPDNNDYICLTDMAHFKDRERTNYIIQNWMRLRSTIDFLGLWEKLNNPKAFVDEIHFCGDNVNALLPDSFLKASNSMLLKWRVEQTVSP